MYKTPVIEGHCPGEFSSNVLQNPILEVSSNPEDLYSLDQVHLIRVEAKLCRAVALQELSLTTLH